MQNRFKTWGILCALVSFVCFIALPFSLSAQYTGTGTFNKITSLDDLSDGYYVILNSTEQFAMNSAHTGSLYPKTDVNTVTNQLIDPLDDIVWFIASDGGGRTIQSLNTNQFAAYTGGGNAIQTIGTVSNDSHRWSFTLSGEDFEVTNLATVSTTSQRRLRYNSGSPRFVCYSTSFGQNLRLFKLSAPDDDDDNNGPGEGVADLLISEYVEGSSNNKYIEIYNGTGSAVDLSDYALEIYSNGSTTAFTGSPALTGILPNESTIVYQNSSANLYAGAINNSAITFNGNDALALVKNGEIIDIVGTIGSNAVYAEEITLRRNLDVCSPNPVFNLSAEWNTAQIDDISNLGTHEAGCSLPAIAEPIELGLTCPENLEIDFDADCQALLPDFTTGITEVVLASPDDFSGVQGDVWEYGMHTWGDWENFVQLPNFTGFIWDNPGSAFNLPTLDALGGHPEVDDPFRVATRRWTSNLAGEITVYGDFYDRDPTPNCGDGVNVRIYQNGIQFYEYENVPSFSIGYSQNIVVEVGDVIDFVIDRKFDGGCDNTHFTNNIKVAVTESQTPEPGTPITELTVVSLSLLTEGGAGQSCQFEVNPVDNTPPDAVCQDITLELDASGEALLSPADINNGSADNCSDVILEISQDVFTCENIGPAQEVTLTVTDQTGNESSCVANVSVVDLIAPQLSVDETVYLSLDENGQIVPTAELLGATATDNCGAVDITVSPENETLDCNNIATEAFPNDLIISTYVEGSSNNKYVEIYNGTGASVNLANYELRLYANGAVNPTTVNNLGVAGTLENGSVAVFRNSQANIYPGTSYVLSAVNWNGDDAFDLYNTTTGTAVDIFGSIGQDPGSQWSENGITTQNQTLVRESFVINGNTSNAVNFPALGQEWIGLGEDDISVLGSHTTNALTGTPVTVTATDENGNITQSEVTLIISDDAPPVLENMPADISVVADPATCSAAAEWTTPTAEDNCSAGLTSNYNSGDVFPLGETVVEYTATDPSGNAVSASFTVSVSAPLLQVEISVTDEILCFEGIATILATATGGCEPYTYAWNGDISTAEITAGAGLQTVEVTDANGETATAQITITEPAALELTTSTTTASCVDSEDGSASVSIQGGTAPYTINWSNGVDTETAENLAVGNYDVTVTDFNGCEASANVEIDFSDTTPPNAIANSITVELDANGQVVIAPADIDGGSTDACGIALLELSQTAFDCAHVGENNVVLTVTDVNGNPSTANAVVTVEDNMAPTAVCQDITVQLDPSGYASIEADHVDGGSTDNCSVVSLSLDQSIFDCTHIGGNLVKLTVQDASGNIDTCNAIVTVLEPLVLPSAEIVSSLELTDNGNVVIFDNAPASINLPASVVLTASLSPSDYIVSGYQWAYRDLPDGFFVDIDGANDNTLTIESDGDSHREYRVEMLTETGCDASATIVVFSVDVSCKGNNKVMVCHVPPGNPNNAKEICVSVNAVPALLANSDSYLGSCDLGQKAITADKVAPEVRVYPNPSWGRFIVNFKEAELRAEQIFVFDMQGRKIMGVAIQDYTGAFQMELNLSEYENGMYMMNIVGAGQVIATERIMKTH